MSRRTLSPFSYSLGSLPLTARPSAVRHRRRRALGLILIFAAGAGLLWIAGAHRHPAPQPPPRVTAVPRQPAPTMAVAVDQLHAYSSTWLRDHPASDAPAVSARNAVVADLEGRRVLYAKDANQRVPVASLTKIVTAMVALDLVSPERVVVVPAAATEIEPNHMGLSAGEKLTIRELLYGLLLDSGNDAAEAIAAGTVGRAAFTDAMNRKARGLGLHDSQFENASGIDGAGQYSSAYDVAVLAGTMLEYYPELRAIVGTKEITIASEPGHKWFHPYNLNRLVWTYPGALGIKPGYTDGAQYTLAAAANRDGRTLIAVVLGSQRHFTDGAALLDYGFQRAALP